ncbi:hypothetical protein BDZ89DRAFT_290521 [Hymenopellis radicata]|nr:hypothetical protein BDZ89DRAFT_290521 [Hymenopellis radicata]
MNDRTSRVETIRYSMLIPARRKHWVRTDLVPIQQEAIDHNPDKFLAMLVQMLRRQSFASRFPLSFDLIVQEDAGGFAIVRLMTRRKSSRFLRLKEKGRHTVVVGTIPGKDEDFRDSYLFGGGRRICPGQ